METEQLRIVLPDTLNIDSAAASKLIDAGDGIMALLYLYLLKNGGRGLVRDAAAAIKYPEEEVRRAMSRLCALGLSERNPKETPAASQKPDKPMEKKTDLAENPIFSALVVEIQRRLGKILSSRDLETLYSICEELTLPPEVILLLVNHCIEEQGRRYGQGRMPTMRYIESQAFSWEKKELKNLEKAEAYLKRLEAQKEAVQEVKRLFRLGDRALAPTEEEFIHSWLEKGFSPEVLAYAYDKTVVKTGKLSWAYLDKIILSWDAQKLATIEEIREKDGKKSGKPSAVNGAATHIPDSGDIVRMKKLLDRLNKE